MNWLKIGAITLVAVLGLAFVACGDDDDGGDDGGGATETPAANTGPDRGATDEPTEAPTDEPTDATDGAEDEFQVDAADFSFAPASINVPAGTEVKFEVTNTGAAPHTMTVYRDNAYTDAVEGGGTGTLAGGEDGDVVVTLDAGMYFFRCEIHPGIMQGTITAE